MLIGLKFHLVIHVPQSLLLCIYSFCGTFLIKKKHLNCLKYLAINTSLKDQMIIVWEDHHYSSIIAKKVNQ
jgi:hypothetical protein